MTVLQKRNSESVSVGWRMCHMVLYTVTGILGFMASVVYYLVVVRSHYRCYQYNEVLIVYEQPGGSYKLHWSDRRVWYRNSNCYDAFTFPLAMSVLSAVWTGMGLVFGFGGFDSSGREHHKYFRFVVPGCLPPWSSVSEILHRRSIDLFKGFAVWCSDTSFFSFQRYCRPLAYGVLGLFI